MREELDKKLCDRYPLIFRDRNAPMTHTAMFWGFECGDGWYNIIDVLCGLLCSDYFSAKSRYDFVKDRVGEKMYTGSGDIITQGEIDLRKTRMDEEAGKVPVASQVKEKMGGLRFYIDGATDQYRNYISFAESMSYRTCEQCGAPGERRGTGWLYTACDQHATE